MRLGPLFNWPFVRYLRPKLRLLADAGTAGYPPDIKRRLKILNMIGYLIAATTFLYAIQLTQQGFKEYRSMVLMNLGLVVAALMVPFAHRVSEIAGGLLIVGAEYAALMGFTAFFSREAGLQLQFIIAAAAPFVIFDLKRIRLITLIVLLGLTLHLCAWFWFPAIGGLSPDEHLVAELSLRARRRNHLRPHRGLGLLRVQPR